MKKKLKKLIELNEDEFNSFIESNEIHLRPAKLIPRYKVGDEMALTSIFLAAIKYIKEYRASFFSDIKLSKAGKALFFTEASFPHISNQRFDGLIVIVSAGKIKDAVIFEMKNKNNKVDPKQVESYMGIIKSLGIDKMVTISNEFTPNQNQLPYEIKKIPSIDNYHFSWTYLLTIAHLLLFKNETNIEDDDQVNLMSEVLDYLEAKESGVTDFNQMKPGWKELSLKIISKSAIKSDDKCVKEAVESWVQEEKDMGLMLSRELGVMVKLGRDSRSYKLENDVKKVIHSFQLQSQLKVIGSVSEILIDADFKSKTVSMSVEVGAPLDKGSKGRLGWMLRQIEKCKQRNESDFESLEKELFVDVSIKYSRKKERQPFHDFDKFYELDKAVEITSFNVVLVRNFGRNFEHATKFVKLIEDMLKEFYRVLVQNLSNWDRPAPKLTENTD